MRHAMKISMLAVFAAAAMAFTPASAASARIENAKNSCIIGEQADGYLGIVTGASADAELRREVRDVNQQRKAVYADIAQRNEVTIEVAAALTAEKLMNQAGPGQCIRDASGSWIKR